MNEWINNKFFSENTLKYLENKRRQFLKDYYGLIFL